MHRRFFILIPLVLALGQPSAPAHTPMPERALLLSGEFDEPGTLSAWSDAMAREMQATLIADGLMQGQGWARADCVDTIDLVGAPASKSFSFCYKYDSDHKQTLAAIESIFSENRTQWIEVGWTQFPGAVGGVYQSTWDPQRYLVVVVGGYHTHEGYTDVIVGVAKERIDGYF